VDIAGWEDLVTGIDKPFAQNGFVKVPDKPGLGVEFNEEVGKKFLRKDSQWFAPTEEWNARDAHDRTWS
jgi:hypothetical protein